MVSMPDRSSHKEWSLRRLVDFAEIVTGTTPPTRDRSNYGDEYLFVGPGDLGQGKWVINTQKKLSKKGFLVSRRFPKDTILFTCIGSTIGKSGIASTELTANQQINAILPNESYCPEYLYYALSQMANKISALAGHQAVPIINKTEFGQFLIPFPPTKSEQEAIVAVLSDADALIATLEKLIDKKRNIKRALMQELLRPMSHWKTVMLGALGKTYGGLSGKSKDDFTNGKYPYIPFMNVVNNAIIDPNYVDYVSIKPGEMQNVVQTGDLLFNGSSETPEEVGMCSVLLDAASNLYLNSFCFGYRLSDTDKVDGLYLAYFFRSGYGRALLYALAQGATRYNLSKSALMKVSIPIPPKQEQVKIATILYDIDQEISAINDKVSKYEAIKIGIMQQLLTGRIRLI